MKVYPVIGEPGHCLRCGEQLTAASHVGDSDPALADQRAVLEWVEGSISVCAYCLHVAIFVIDRGQIARRPVRRDEWDEVWRSLDKSAPDLAPHLRAANVPPA